jgi:predicted ATPase
MITHIKIDGFKSFLDFRLDVPPFLALVGPNASGKSNLFDALHLVADVVESGPERALTAQSRGSARDFFHRASDGNVVDRLTIEVGVIVPSPGDPLAMRCRLRLARSGDRPYVEECIASVDTPDELEARRGDMSKAVFGALRRARAEFDTTGAPHRISVAGRHERTWGELAQFSWTELGTWEAPHPDDLLWRLLVGECRSWRFLALDPSSMRKGAPAPDVGPLAPSAANVAAVLHRLRDDEQLWQVEADLAALVPGPTEIIPLFDERRQEYDFDIVFKNTGRLSPRLLSDGTLRALALSAASHDPAFPGVLLIEEIENGLHPARVAELARRLERGLPDLRGAEPFEVPRQVLITTHSPALVSSLWPDQAGSLVFTEMVTHIDGARRSRSQVTRALPVAETGEPGGFASPWDVERFLATVQERDR